MATHCNARPRWVRVGRVLVGCALLSMLGACGSGFVYNRLDWLSRYYLSSQVTLDDA